MTRTAGRSNVKLLCCSIVKREIDFLIRKHGLDIEPEYINCTLHVFPEQIKKEVSHVLEPGQVIIYGNKCFAGIKQVALDNQAVLIGAENCVEMILGPDVAAQDQYANAFFLTPGWFENWDPIFKKTLQWDEVSARLSFGICDRMIIIDTGLVEMSDLAILEIFDYSGLPVEFYKTNLDYLEQLLLSSLNKAGLQCRSNGG